MLKNGNLFKSYKNLKSLAKKICSYSITLTLNENKISTLFHTAFIQSKYIFFQYLDLIVGRTKVLYLIEKSHSNSL